MIIPGGIAGVIAIGHDDGFTTQRGAFWTIVGTTGFISAFVAFPRAMQVDSVAGLLAWVGAWLATILLFGVPFGWWVGRQ